MSNESLINLIFSGGTALAGLILVFLGATLNAYDSYDADAQPVVKPKYKQRAILAFAGFLASLVSAVLAFAAGWCGNVAWLNGAMFALGISFLLLLIMAATSLMEVW